MGKHEPETQAYIDRHVERALATKALNKIRNIVDQIEIDDKKARIAVYIFVLLFTAIALLLFFIISHTP